MPDRPGKLRGKVRRLLRPIAGAWPMPMHPMQPVWWIRAPALDQAERRAHRGQVGEDLPRGGVDVEGDLRVGLAAADDRGQHGEVAQPGVGRGARRRPGRRARPRPRGPARRYRASWAWRSAAPGWRGRSRPSRRSQASGSAVSCGEVTAAPLALAGTRGPARPRGRRWWSRRARRPCWRSRAGPWPRATSSPGPWYSMIRPTPPLTPWRRSISRMTSLALTHGGSVAGQPHAPDLRHREVQRLAGHRHRDLQAAHADGEHAQRAGRAGVRVRAGQRRARPPEPLHVHRVRDPVARPGVPEPEPLAGRAQEQVVGHVALVGLQQVVVDVLRPRPRCGPGPGRAPRARASPSCPVASWVSVWSIRSPISGRPSSRRRPDARRSASARRSIP